MIGFFTAVLIATLIGAISSVAVTLYAWKRRKSPVAATFAALMGMTAISCFIYVGIWSSPDDSAIYAFARMRFAGLSLMSALYLLFVLEYVGWQPWRRPSTALLLVIPLVTQFLLWTNEAHHLFFTSWDIMRVGPYASEIIVYGPAWQLHALQSYSCMAVGIFLLLRAAMRNTGVYAVQSLLMFFGSLVVVLLNFPISFLLASQPVPNLTPISYAIAGAIFVFALQRDRLLDLVPVAFDAVYNSMDDALLLLDSQRRIVAANPAALNILNQPKSHVLGCTLDAAFAERKSLLAQITALDGAAGEIVNETGGQKRYYDLRTSAVTNGSEARGIVMVLRDITERRINEKRSLELALEQEKVRLLSGFIRDTSHELRTPLTVMNTALYLARKAKDPGHREEKLAEIEAQIHQVQRIVEGLLLLTSLDTATTMDISVFRLNALIDPLSSDVLTLIESKRQHLRVELHDDTCRGDVTLLRRAVHNLLHNAALYTPEGGTITVRGQRTDEQIVVEVEDTGIGIPADDITGIFERFMKVNRARTANGSGAGLGLPIVRKIAQLHSGDVTVSSVQGSGSVFRLTFPASQRVRAAAQPASTA